MALTDQELLLLDNIMYADGSIDTDFETLGELVEYYKNNLKEIDANTLCGGFESEEGLKKFEKILEEIEDNDKLMKLEMREVTNAETDVLVRARCFVECDEEGNDIGYIVAFRGTSPWKECWIDNVKGLFMEETPSQKIAREFIEDLPYDNITVTGHSKGGNHAMYVTMACEEKVQSCVSYDGQGFGEACLNKMTEEKVETASDKIKSVSAHNDFINILLSTIAGIKMFVENKATGKNAHSPYDLYVSNEEQLDANGGMFTEELAVEQDSLWRIAHNAQDLVIDALSEDQEELVADTLGPVAGFLFGRDGDVASAVGSIGKDTAEYYFEQGHLWKDMISNIYGNTIPGSVDKTLDKLQYLYRNQDTIKDIGESAKECVGDFGETIEESIGDFFDDLTSSNKTILNEKLVLTKAADDKVILSDKVDLLRPNAPALKRNTVGELQWDENMQDNLQNVDLKSLMKKELFRTQ